MQVTTSARPDLSDLTPVEAQKIVEQYIRLVNPAIAEQQVPAIETGRVPAGSFVLIKKAHQPADLIPYSYHSHFVAPFDSTSPLLSGLVKSIAYYANAAEGKADVTPNDDAMFSQAFASAWDIIDHSKKSGSALERGLAGDLEEAILSVIDQPLRKPETRKGPARTSSWAAHLAAHEPEPTYSLSTVTPEEAIDIMGHFAMSLFPHYQGKWVQSEPLPLDVGAVKRAGNECPALKSLIDALMVYASANPSPLHPHITDLTPEVIAQLEPVFAQSHTILAEAKNHSDAQVAGIAEVLESAIQKRIKPVKRSSEKGL